MRKANLEGYRSRLTQTQKDTNLEGCKKKQFQKNCKPRRIADPKGKQRNKNKEEQSQNDTDLEGHKIGYKWCKEDAILEQQ